MTRLLYRLEHLVRDHPEGWFVLIAMAAVLVFGLACAVAMVVKRRSRWLLMGMLLAEGVLLGVAGYVVEIHERDLLMLRGPPTRDLDPSRRARIMAETLSNIIETQYFATCVSTVALVLAAVALWRQRPWGGSRRYVALAMSLGLVTMGTILVRHEYWYGGSYYCDGGIEPNCKARLLWRVLLEGGRVIRVGQDTLWAVGAVGALVIIWLGIRDARRDLLASRRSVLTSSALLGLGVLATLSMRARAFDGAHPVPPLWEGDDQSIPVELDFDVIPRGPAGCAMANGPILTIDGPRVDIDGIAAVNPSELEQKLVVKRELWHQVNPFHRRQYHTVRVVAARSEALQEIWPWLEGARHAGFDQIAVVYRVEPSALVHTATAGVLTRIRYCDAIWRGSALPGKTWNDLAAAAVTMR